MPSGDTIDSDRFSLFKNGQATGSKTDNAIVEQCTNFAKSVAIYIKWKSVFYKCRSQN